MRVIANSQLHGVYGTKIKDEVFEVSDSLGHQLLERGMVRKASAFAGEVKAIQPATPPFHGARMSQR